jgi:hypothetical protein
VGFRGYLTPFALSSALVLLSSSAARADGPSGGQIYSPSENQSYSPGTQQITVQGEVWPAMPQYSLVVQIVDPSTTPDTTLATTSTASQLDGGFTCTLDAPTGGWPPGKQLAVEVLYNGNLVCTQPIQSMPQ